MKPEKAGFCVRKVTSAGSTTWSANSSTLQRKNQVSGRFISDQATIARQRTAVKLAREELAQGGLIRLRVSGDSMAPLIEPGDVVLVRHVNPEDLRRGDLILVEQGGAFLTHRLVAADAHLVRTKGDNASHADPPVLPQDVLGRVIGVEKGDVVSLSKGDVLSPPKDGRRIELDEGRWPMVNRLLGLLGWCEVKLFAAGRIIKRRLVGERSGCWPQGLTSLAATPFRWLTRLLLIKMRGFTDDLTG